jgi:hypothetical protein
VSCKSSRVLASWDGTGYTGPLPSGDLDLEETVLPPCAPGPGSPHLLGSSVLWITVYWPLLGSRCGVLPLPPCDTSMDPSSSFWLHRWLSFPLSHCLPGTQCPGHPVSSEAWFPREALQSPQLLPAGSVPQSPDGIPLSARQEEPHILWASSPYSQSPTSTSTPTPAGLPGPHCLPGSFA